MTTGPNPFPSVEANSFGDFAFGVGMFGSIPNFDYQKTIASQFANSPRITQLLNFFFQWFDPTRIIDDWYGNVWDIVSARGYGLDVWGRIVGVSRQLQVATGKYFGFSEGNVNLDYDNFGPGGQSPFYAGELLTTNYTLTDQVFRTLIYAKAAANISDGSIPSLNNILMTLFGQSGTVYVNDVGGMVLDIVFEFIPTPLQLAIVTNSGVLPIPTGVTANIVVP